MRTSIPLRVTASVMLCGLVIAACGQKPGVRVGDEGLAAGTLSTDTVQDQASDTLAGDQGGTAVTDGGTAAPGGATATDTGASATGGQETTGAQQQTTGAQQETTGGQQETSGGQQETTGGQQQQQQQAQQAQLLGNDFTGAPEEKIVIGLHAPATGAAPLPTTSFQKAKDTYWKWTIDNNGPVLGREKVDVLFRDDKYDPNNAGNICKQLAEEAFLVGGGGGTDQIQRCGQLAAVQEFPYFSAGVTEAGLRNNPWYFASSMTYRQQGGLLAQYIAKNPDNNPNFGKNAKIGTIITDTANFDDALAGWRAGLKANGLQMATLSNGQEAVVRHTKNDDTWISGTAREFDKSGINVVYILTAPTLYLDFANEADTSFDFNPQYVGVGVSMGLNAVLNGGCKEVGSRDDNGIFLSPFPGVDRAPEAFKKASADYGAPADDIALALWGLAEGQHKLFSRYEELYGQQLERKTFRYFVENQAGRIETSVYPTIQYSQGAEGHFGANAAYVLDAVCGDEDGDGNPDKQYRTLTPEPVSGF